MVIPFSYHSLFISLCPPVFVSRAPGGGGGRGREGLRGLPLPLSEILLIPLPKPGRGAWRQPLFISNIISNVSFSESCPLFNVLRKSDLFFLISPSNRVIRGTKVVQKVTSWPTLGAILSKAVQTSLIG